LGAGPAGIAAARRLVGRGLVVGIAEAAIAAAQEDDSLTGDGEVDEDFLIVLVEHLRADRHAQHDRIAIGAGAVAPGAAAPVLGAEMLAVAVVDQGVEIGHRLEDDVAAAPAIAAVGSAELDEFLPPEAGRAGRPRRSSGRSCIGRGIARAGSGWLAAKTKRG